MEISLSHNAMDFSASILINVITSLRQINVLTKKDFFGEYKMNRFFGGGNNMILKNEGSLSGSGV